MAAAEEVTATPNTTANESVFIADDYIYDEDYEDEMCNTSSLLEFVKVSSPLFLSTVAVLGLLGNGLVVVIVLKYEKVKFLTNALILNLAASDLLFAAALPFWAYYDAWGWALGDCACKLVSFVFDVGFCSSGLILITMTIQRHVAVLNPLSGLASAAGVHSLLASILMWAASVLMSVPAVILTTVVEQTGQSHCEYDDSASGLWGIYQQNVLFVLISGVFLFCYPQILCRLLRPSARRRKNKTLKLIFTLMLVFFVGWAPYNVTHFLKSLRFWPHTPVDSETVAARCASHNHLDFAFHLSKLLAFSHCSLNPVLYVFVGSKFKSHLKKMMRCQRHDDGDGGGPNRRVITSLSSGDDLCV
ncbi:chemokine XC receptor 1-like [Syngnathoides biaculeatus]|uniref:chemokine XC receptor 1-like n=1 Tax=Syngnathoides biaculeatus TaxID=300417 RepID=UPI002ADE317E|nr:chemokine XC receptor 1-like [Syngnathoides biaculeatus]XP_061694903.1 chemokine XC receptor 1-like [Syngnathoides biaculeatus]XP_061694904.1 chemokine XC receptor 1-like [Syngnathoides biaculeatus]